MDLTIRNGTVATATETTRCDIGIDGEKIVAMAAQLPPGKRDIDAKGRYVLPGGIDSHCHIEQLSGMGIMSADDFYSGTVSAAFGGTTTIIPFAAQHRGTSVTTTVADYHERARSKAVIDYGFHLIIGDPTDKVLQEELPAAIKGGITSFKVYMTYPKWKLEDYQLLEVISVAERERALVMVHAENDDMIRWIAKHLVERGHGAPKFHGVAHAVAAAGRAGADRACLEPGGDEHHPRRADPGREDLRRDLPAISGAHRRGHGQARRRRRQVVLQPAAA
jgi:dihydropyrimidinase